MADLSALEELLLSGYDVSALLAGAPGNAGAGLGVLALEAQLKNAGLPQSGLGWPSAGANDQTALYQEVAQSLAAKLEEHRMQQVQVATALQQLQALQQQQELAQLQQQINALHQPMRANPFQRSRTTDLECMGRSPAFDVPGPYGPALDYEQRQQLAALQSVAHPGTSPSLGLQQRVPGVISQHNLPVRSFSSEHLVAGQRRVVPPHLAGVQPAPNGVQASTKRPPVRQPSGLGPNGRGNNQGARANDGGRRARYAATAKAPSWASEDWHPMKAVIASGAHASGGTGVFLPHLAGSAPDSNGKSSCSGTGSSSVPSAGSTAPGASPTLPARCISDSPAPAVLAPAPVLSLGTASGHAHPHVASAVGLQPLHAHAHPHAHGQMALAAAPHAAAAAAAVAGLHSPLSPRDGSPSCSVDSNAAADPYSRGTTHEFSRASTGGFVELDVSHVPHPGAHSHPASGMGYLTADPMKVVVEEPEREKEDTAEECDFASLARELAELMSKQAVVE